LTKVLDCAGASGGRDDPDPDKSGHRDPEVSGSSLRFDFGLRPQENWNPNRRQQSRLKTPDTRLKIQETHGDAVG